MNGESDSLGTSSAGSESDPLSMLLSSMVQKTSNTIPGMLSGSMGISSASSPTPNEQLLKCQICKESFQQPKVLACFHSFCKNCLERQLDESNEHRLVCPQCHVETQLCAQLGIDGLLSDYGLEKVARVAAAMGGGDDKGLIFGSPSSTSSSPPLGDICDQNSNTTTSTCTGCKSGEKASTYCYTCLFYLCTNCTLAHRYMHCFEGHRVEELSNSGVSSGIASSVSDSVSPPSLVSAAVAAAAAAARGQKSASPTNSNSHCKCLEHRSQPLRYFCITCNLAICRDCISGEHQAPTHNVENIDSVAEKQIGLMETLISEAHKKQTDLHQMFKLIDAGQNRLNVCFQQAQNHIDEIANCLIQLVQEARQNITKELENVFGCKQLQLTINETEVQKMVKKMSQTIEFTQRLLKYSSPTEVMVFKPLLDTRLQGFLTFNANINTMLHACEIRTQNLDMSRARQGIFSLMNILQTGDMSAWATNGVESNRQSTSPPSQTPNYGQQPLQQHMPHHITQQQPIGRPLSRQLQQSPPVGNGVLSASSFHNQSLLPSFVTSSASATDLLLQQSKLLENDAFGGNGGSSSQSLSGAGNNLYSTQMINNALGLSSHHHQHLTSAIGTSAPTGGILSSALEPENSLVQGCSLGENVSGSNTIFNQYEKWSSGLDPSALGALSLNDPETITDLSILASSVENKGGAFALYPPRSQIKRQKMTYHCRFGEFGVMEGQFTEPSGVAVNAQNHIVVADTNNHRIQVFDKEGRFKFQFGECGKRDGQLLYPNRVSVNRVTGDFIVTERSPTHQIQIYNQYGQFLRKFGANILQHPRGVCVDNQGRIIVVECKVMRVIIFDTYGNIIQKFSCSRYLEFPNGVCANDKNEILISDNRAHCIKVFNYEGHYVRQIGGEGITNYPIGVGINANGEVVVADNHNNFNLTVFSQDGTMLSALESKVKHAQCFDVALVEDGSVVLASKDYRLYLYRYQQQPGQPILSSMPQQQQQQQIGL